MLLDAEFVPFLKPPNSMWSSHQIAALSNLTIVLSVLLDGGTSSDTDLVNCGAPVAALTRRSQVEGILKT